MLTAAYLTLLLLAESLMHARDLSFDVLIIHSLRIRIVGLVRALQAIADFLLLDLQALSTVPVKKSFRMVCRNGMRLTRLRACLLLASRLVSQTAFVDETGLYYCYITFITSWRAFLRGFARPVRVGFAASVINGRSLRQIDLRRLVGGSNGPLTLHRCLLMQLVDPDSSCLHQVHLLAV